MARLSIAVLTLFAVAAVVSAGAPPPPPKGHAGPHGHVGPKGPAGPKGKGPAPAGGHLKAWLHQKEAQLKQWAGQEKAKLQGEWKEKVVPHIHDLTKKFGQKWQEKAPKIAALLKQKAGAAFDKAVNFVNQKLAPQGQPPKLGQGQHPKKA
ncbi:hypothetical protein FOCC_FOCC015994 [Frankliniella occidentalis]|uniref:Uncharacterized protein LOC113217880 n=1 Tax=Frankliniella occidentalis TaxID=133901 RepID=A0A6J1TSW1_FRAOC|nr:uncharacterized protein LOC113217880 [Frankliniella occidentalis]KAE8738518.1 hypothetical protein FOCC_FOCC015994 [Frankliniella occidentalis]